MKRLIRLYPKAWRQRYGPEFAALLEDLAAHPTSGPRMVYDISAGAVDAHLAGGYGLKRLWADSGVRTGAASGLGVSAALALLAFLTNVVFPGGPEQSDADPQVLIPYLITLAILAGLLITIGAWGARRMPGWRSGLKSGATAGAVIAVMITVTMLAINNLFLDIVSQHHDKRVAFAVSGATSMRAFLNIAQLQGGLLLVPVLAIIGGALGLLGATVVKRPPANASQQSGGSSR